METIFDYNPTDEELVKLFDYDRQSDSMSYGFSVFSLPNKDYDKENSDEGKLFDIAKLLELRGMKKEASTIWSKIPDVQRQYKGGFDYEQIKG
ncbi:hypothetical protein [Pedobacter agri]|uniref:hypothetical protein n=1 Tax=Pedobacter agri TaxID=454586 RepID=UPI002930251F|nr:hypothetical protein [Pedobacter agri]